MKQLLTFVFAFICFPWAAGTVLAQGNMTSQQENFLKRWTTAVVENVLTYSYKDIRDKEESDRKYFTREGYKVGFALREEMYFRIMTVAQRVVAEAEVICVPFIDKRWTRNNRSYWQLSVPVRVRLNQLPEGQQVKTQIVSLTVRESYEPQNTARLGVEGWIEYPIQNEAQIPNCVAPAPGDNEINDEKGDADES